MMVSIPKFTSNKKIFSFNIFTNNFFKDLTNFSFIKVGSSTINMTVDEFTKQGRRILIIANDMPAHVYKAMVQGLNIQMICADKNGLGIIEVLPGERKQE